MKKILISIFLLSAVLLLKAQPYIAIQADGTIKSTLNGSTLVTPTGVTAAMIGLGNVTNESKATMFTSPTFTGNAVLGTPASGTLTNCTFPTLNQNTTGTAAGLTTARTINGTSFDGTGNITITAAAGTLTGATLASGVTASSLTSFGASIALGTPASGNLANCTFPTLNQNTTGTANIAGGTAGAIVYQSGANASTVLAATATANKVLMSGASAAPTWSTPTFPNASATAGKRIQSDGTNWIASTSTLSDVPGTAGKVLISDGTNWITSTPTFPNASATSGKVIKSDGTNFVASTETYAAPGTSGNVLQSDGTNWTAVNSRTNWTSFVVSGSDATTTGQTLTDITGLTSGTLTNATKYEIEAWLDVTTSAVTTGTQYAVFANGTGGAAVYNALVQGTTTTNAITQVTQSSATQQGTFLTTSGTAGIIYIHGFITTRGTGTATISIQHLKVTSGTSTVKVGSKMLLRLAN